MFVARFEAGQWVTRQVTQWDYRWEFEGGGSIPFEIGLGVLQPHGAGRLAMSYSHVKHGGGLLVLDEQTLALAGTEQSQSRYPADLGRPESRFPEMQVKWAEDSGKSDEPGSRFVLRWETLGPNRDRPRSGEMPEPSRLRLYRLSGGR